MSYSAFQTGVIDWLFQCFGHKISSDKMERADRLIEEQLELVQSVGYPAERVIALLHYVYSRPIGEPRQETGGVMVTLAAFCWSHGIDLDEAANAELARVWTKIDAIRAKQAAKPTGSALPITTPLQDDKTAASRPTSKATVSALLSANGECTSTISPTRDSHHSKGVFATVRSEPISRQDALDFLGVATRNWHKMPQLDEDDINDVVTALSQFVLQYGKAAASASKFKATAPASEHHKDGSAGVLPLQAGNCTHESGDWLSTMEAPKDGSMLRLLVIPHEASFTGFDDDLDPYETIGFNNLSNTGEDRWEFVGWDWSHDQFITGQGEVVGWQRFASASEGGAA